MQMHKNITKKGIREFIGLEEKCNTIHNFKYSYTKTVYKFATSKTIIICPIHGEFQQNIRDHLLGHGCRQCARKAVGNKAIKSTTYWTKQASKVHNNKYDYSLVDYTHSKIPITIVCPIHGPFEQTPDNHLSGCGCPSCATTGFDPSKPGILYYLSINNGQAYKIGITNKSVKDRFGPDMQYIYKYYTKCITNLDKTHTTRNKEYLKNIKNLSI